MVESPLFDFSSVASERASVVPKTRKRIRLDVPGSVTLTASQIAARDECARLFTTFQVVAICGDSGSGKNTVAMSLLSQMSVKVIHFDICRLAERSERCLSAQDVFPYFDEIVRDCSPPFVPGGQAVLSSTIRTVIYFRNFDRSHQVFTDTHAKNRYLTNVAFRSFFERLPRDTRVLLTGYRCDLPEGSYWKVSLTTTRDDMLHVFLASVERGTIREAEIPHLLAVSKIVTAGKISYALRYVEAMNGKLTALEAYKKALTCFSGANIDAEQNVPFPASDELVGIDELLEEIDTAIITPMTLGNPNIPIKKGILLCGPPGTGKTSIGRWLAHRIKGKFYLIGGEAGINGHALIDALCSTVAKAQQNAPAVIFVDDGDTLFSHDDTYRAFLTVLDGIETNKRSGVCVILTCMNPRTVPASLVRGGRLEMTLITRLPDKEKIALILAKSLDRLVFAVESWNEEVAAVIREQITPEIIANISVKMAGWNCADINRAVNDVTRMVTARRGTNVAQLFDGCIRRVREQYMLCGRCDSLNYDSRPYDSYIG